MVEDVPLLAVRCSAQKTTESAGRLFAERENLCPKLNRKKMKSRNPSSATLVALTVMKYIGAKAQYMAPRSYRQVHLIIPSGFLGLCLPGDYASFLRKSFVQSVSFHRNEAFVFYKVLHAFRAHADGNRGTCGMRDLLFDNRAV